MKRLRSRIDLSIIIVNYKVEKHLFKCLDSIREKVKGVLFEVIIVENETKTNLIDKIKKYKFVNYIKSPKNLGFGGGNNLGSKYAKGNFLFFLNPDTKIEKGKVSDLLKSFTDKKIGIVGPILLNSRREIYDLQGTRELTPVSAFFSLSFIYKFFPNNPWARKFWLKDWDKTKVREVEVVPGTAFIIPREIFNKIGGFDERLFLFFEENDICNRIRHLGYKLLMDPRLRVVHLWAESTKQEKNTRDIFLKSRFFYFKKHYGLIIAFLINSFLNFNLSILLISLIIFLGLFLMLDKFNYLIRFIGD